MVQFIYDNTFTHVIGASESDNHAIYNCLSYKVKNFEAVKRRMAKTNPRMRNWDGTKSFYDRRSKRFLSGFLPRLTSYYKSMGMPYEVIDKRANVIPKSFNNDSIPELDGIELRDYQKRSILDASKNLRGVAKLATGAGKTEIAIALTAKAGVPTLFLTHRVNLLYQTAKRFAKRLPHMKNKIGIIGDSQFSPGEITIGTVQTLHNLIKKHPDVAKELLSKFHALIIDEAHRSGSSQFHETAQYCTNAKIRIALTATPFMKGNEEEDMYLEGITGGIITNVSAGELIEAGVLARPFFRFIPVNTPLDRKYTNWRDIYEFGIVKNVARNKIIVQQAMKLIEMNKKILVIVQEVTHGRIIEDVMKNMGIASAYVDGSDSYAERNRALNMLSKGKIDAVICTNIFDEGVDVEDIGGVILAAGCKSAPALFQRTGRAIRKKEDDNFAIIIDFIDNHHQKLHEHSIVRYEMIKNEKGFVIV